MQGKEPRPSVTSRVLSILGSFDEEHRLLSLSEIARRSGLPLSTTHRLLAELQSWDAIERDADGNYVVGRRLWQLGTLANVQRELRDIALPAMQDLLASTQENVHLAIRQDTVALFVERLYGKNAVQVTSRAGRTLPLHATGVGKVLLAHAPAEVVDACLASLEAVTAHTITDPGRLRAELAEVRRHGFARTAQEMTLGTYSIAVAIRDPLGTVVAAMGLVTSDPRAQLASLLPALRMAAATISRGIPIDLEQASEEWKP